MTFRWQDRIRKPDAWLLSFLKTHKVPFIIFGGAAVAFHGCRDDFYFDDIDVLLCPTETHSKNFALAVNAAARAAGKMVTTSFPPLQFAKLNEKMNLDPVQFHIDFITMFKPSVFNDYMRNAVGARIELMEVKVLALQDLIRLKQDAVESNYNRHINFTGDAQLIKQSASSRVV